MTLSVNDEVGKLFVGGLSWDSSKENVQEYFSKFGEVVDCVVMKNNETGRSRGFGFVTYKDPNCVSIVLASGPHLLDGRAIDPKACTPRHLQKNKKGGASNFPKVFLGGLPTTATETDLRSFFSKYGKVMEIVIMYDQEKKKSRGFGFLAFESEDSVNQVCSEHFVTISNKQVECKRAEPRYLGKAKGAVAYSQWNTQPMNIGNQGDWGTMGPAAMPSGPNGPPTGQPVANGVMPTGYQPAWGAPPQQTPYGPPSGYPTGYGWGATPAAGYNPYGGAAPQYGQQPYTGFAGPPPMGYNYGGFNPAMGAAGGPPPQNVSQQPAQDPYNQGGNVSTAVTSVPGSAVDTSGYATAVSTGYNQNEGFSGSSQMRTSSQTPGYHPYRRV